MSEKMWKRWLRGMIDRLRDHTEGGDDELRALSHKLDDGALRWVGEKLPYGQAKPAKKRA